MGEALVGRTAEIAAIHGSVEMLVDPQRVLRTPILTFEGPVGSGATMLLGQVATECTLNGITQISGVERTLQKDTPTLEEQLKSGNVALTLELDTLDDGQITSVESGLVRLFQSYGPNKLLVAMATTRPRNFTDRAITRKVTRFLLGPLDRQEADALLNENTLVWQPEFQKIFYEWTGGYPLGLRTLADIVTGRFDPRNPADHKQIMSQLSEKVIDQKVLALAPSPEARTRMHELLALLAVPHGFNLGLAEDLVQKFAPNYALEGLAGILYAHDIKTMAPGVLTWNRGGPSYGIHETLRPLFNAELRVGDEGRLKEIHGFLAEWNDAASKEVKSEGDIQYYQKESAYHAAMRDSL